MTIDPENIAAEMREAAEAFQHRPQSMRDRAFVEALTAFQTAANPANVLAILADRDALKAEVLEQARLNGMGAERELALMARIVALEKAAVCAVLPLEAFNLAGRLEERFGVETAAGIREGVATVRKAIGVK